MCLGTQSSSTYDSRARLLAKYLKTVWMRTKKASGILQIDGLEFSGIIFQFL